MSKLLVIYASIHHQNTKHLLEMASEETAFDMVSVKEAETCDLTKYDCIGLASGVYMSKPHKTIVDFVESHTKELKEKAVFTIFTSGSKSKKGIALFSEQMKEIGLTINGTFRCKGFDTYGLFKLIGGTNKGHPNKADAKELIRFLKEKE